MITPVFFRPVLVALAIVSSAGCGLAATPSKHEVLLAIAAMEKSVTSREAVDAAKTVVVYAQLSDDVMVNIGPEELPWTDENWGLGEREQACHSMLLAAFVAGNVKSQIKNDKAEDDTYSGWVFALKTYNRLRSKEDFKSPSMETLSKMQADGTLLQHARDVRFKEEQQGKSDEPHKPMA